MPPADGPVDPSLKPQRLVLYPTRSLRIVGIIGFIAIFLLGFGISAAMFLRGGGPWSLLFAAVTIPGLYLLSMTFAARLWANEQEVGVSSAVQHSRCPREQLSALRVEPGWGKYGPSCAFVRQDGSVAFKAQVNLWGSSQIASMAGFLGLPLLNEVNTTGHVCPVCGYPRLSEPVSVNGAPSHEVCSCCGFAFDDPAQLNDQAYGTWREQWIGGGMTWWGRPAGQPPIDWDPKRQLDALGHSA